MPISLTSRGRDMFESVEVRDPSGQRPRSSDRCRASTTMAEVRARAVSQLRLPEQVEWNLRCERTGRLLNDQQRLDNLTVDDCTQVVIEPATGSGTRLDPAAVLVAGRRTRRPAEAAAGLHTAAAATGRLRVITRSSTDDHCQHEEADPGNDARRIRVGPGPRATC